MEENSTAMESTTPVEGEAVEETVEAEATEAQPEQEAETKEDETDYSSFLEAISKKAVYNGEPMTIESFDDVINGVQKAANYDKMMTKHEQEVERLSNAPETKFMQKFLADNGYEDFISYQTALEVQELTSEGMSEARAIEYIEGQRAKEARDEAQRKQAFEEQKSNLDTNNHADAIKWYADKGYGDLTSDKVTAETWKKVEGGLPMKYAIMEQMFDNVKGDTEQEVLKKLKNHKESSMTSVNSTAEKQTQSWSEMSSADFKKAQKKLLGRSW